MKIRADIAELLHTGNSDSAIARQLRCDRKAVARARAALGLPKTPHGRPTPLADLIAARTEPVEGGHVRWTGTTNVSGTPVLNYRGEGPRSVHRLVFIVRYGREPVGKVRAACGYPRCLAMDHVEDQPMRERNRATYAAIFGRSP